MQPISTVCPQNLDIFNPHPSVQASYVNVPLFYIHRNTIKSHEKGCKNDFWDPFMKAFRSTFCKNRRYEIWRYLWRRCVKFCLEKKVALEVNNELFSIYKPMRRQGPSIHFYEPFSTALNCPKSLGNSRQVEEFSRNVTRRSLWSCYIDLTLAQYCEEVAWTRVGWGSKIPRFSFFYIAPYIIDPN